MSVKLLIDMNLSPEWVDEFTRHGWHSVHWQTVGDFDAEDTAIMEWARANGYVVFTCDLDFGTTLALTHAIGPSVLQVRGFEFLAERISNLVVSALRQHESELKAGALVTIDGVRSRVRVLPL